jgi:hypothetical protein
MSTAEDAPAGVRVEVAQTTAVGEGDPSVQFREESGRALEMTRRVRA